MISVLGWRDPRVCGMMWNPARRPTCHPAACRSGLRPSLVLEDASPDEVAEDADADEYAQREGHIGEAPISPECAFPGLGDPFERADAAERSDQRRQEHEGDGAAADEREHDEHGSGEALRGSRGSAAGRNR